MCDIVEEFAKEYAKEYAEEQKKLAVKEAEEDFTRKLLKEGMSQEKIVSMMNILTAEDVKRMATDNEM